MTSEELIANFENGARQREFSPALRNGGSGRWMTYSEVMDRSREWHDRLKPYSVGNRLVFLRLPSATDLIPALIAAWSLGAITLILDESLPKETEDRIAFSERPTIRIDAEGITVEEDPRKFRTPGLLLGKLTSGTTGEPKTLYFTADQMISDATQIIESMGLCESDRNLAVIPLGHSYGLGNIVFPFLIRFIAIAQSDTYLPHGIASQIKESGATVFPGTPPIFRALCKTSGELDLSRIRLFISAGARLEPNLAKSFQQRFGADLHNFYGSSETGGIAYSQNVPALKAESPIGHPLSGVSVRCDKSGRLVVSSPAVFTYRNRRTRNGMGTFRLSDRGFILEDGSIQLLPRNSGILKIGARRIHTDSLMRTLFSHPDVTDSFVSVVSLDGKDHLALAVEVTQPISDSSFRKYLSENLRHSLIPRRVRILSEFPRTPRGKVDQQKLRDLLHS